MNRKTAALITAMTLSLVHIPSSYASDAIKWNFSDGVLTVSGTGAMENYNTVGKRPWEDKINQITKIVISDGITSVGSWCFADCSELLDIKLPDTLKSVGERAFYNCSQLLSITIPENTETIGSGAFNSCVSVSRVDLPDSLKVISPSAFMNMPSLPAVIIPDSVTELGSRAFFGNTSMKGLYFEGTLPETIGNYIIANIHEDYTIYYELDTIELSLEKKYFDEEHILPFISSSYIPVYLNNSMINFDIQPEIIEGRTLVPVRAIFEAMGATVDWEEETRTVIAKRNEDTIRISINSDVMYKNGEVLKIDVPALIAGGRTFVPLRAISEAFGAEVKWNDSERAIYINF